MVKLNYRVPGLGFNFVVALGVPFPKQKILDIGYFNGGSIKRTFIEVVNTWDELSQMEEFEEENAEQYFKW